MSEKYKTEEEKYLSWYRHEKENNDLIDVKFYAGEIVGTNKEQFYRETNYFNQQLDREDTTPRIKVIF